MSCRCAMCDRVSDGNVTTDPYKIFAGEYYQDPADRTKLYCAECVGSVDDTLSDFVGEDEENPEPNGDSDGLGHYIDDGEVKRNAAKWRQANAR